MMKAGISEKRDQRHLRVFFSVSLLLHLFLFSIATLLFPDLRIAPLLKRNIEVFLLPAIAETRNLPEIPDMKEVLKKPGTRLASHVENKPLPTYPLQNVVRAVAVSDSPPPPPEDTLPSPPETNSAAKEDGKREKEEKKDKTGTTEPILRTNIPWPPETNPTAGDERKESADRNKEKVTEKVPTQTGKIDLFTTRVSTAEKKDDILTYAVLSAKEASPSMAFPASHSHESSGSGTPSPKTSEGSRKAARLQTPSLEEIVLARPRYSENPKPSYPQEARKKGYQGTVVLRVEVLSNGEVGQAEVKNSSGYDILDRSALNAVKQWKFTPAKRGEEAVAFWVNIPIKFQLQ